MTHEEKIARWIPRGGTGAEIGPGNAPIPGLDPAPIYIDCFRDFGAAPCRADYHGHACALPFHDHSLDYVLASHVLEHVANPVAALAEWYRVVRPGGIIYLVVPNHRGTWEHGRSLTTVEHMLEDYARETTAVDPTHIDEFVFQGDWSRFSPETAAADVPAKQAELARTLHWAIQNGEEINIHFHTFDPSNVRALLETLSRGPRIKNEANAPEDPALASGEDAPEKHTAARAYPRFNWEIVDLVDQFPRCSPNGVLAVLRVDKGWRARADAQLFRLNSRGKPKPMLRDDAQPFAEWVARSNQGKR